MSREIFGHSGVSPAPGPVSALQIISSDNLSGSRDQPARKGKGQLPLPRIEVPLFFFSKQPKVLVSLGLEQQVFHAVAKQRVKVQRTSTSLEHRLIVSEE